jgi:excisionase family DNA binding protein
VLGTASRLEAPLVSGPWLSAGDIAAHLGVTKDTIYAWIAENGMPAHKVGRLWKFQSSEVDEWVRTGRTCSPGEDVTSSGT